MKLSFTQKRLLPLAVMPQIDPATNGKNAGGPDARGGVHFFGNWITFSVQAGNGLAAGARRNRDYTVVNEFTAASGERTKAKPLAASARNGGVLETVLRC